jgi:hypothetical protein
MEGFEDEISSLTGDETNKVSSVMEGVDEKITATDGGSDESTPEMSCTELEKMSFWGEFEKMLAGTALRSCWIELDEKSVEGEITAGVKRRNNVNSSESYWSS